jgi:hypothetical protein
VEIRLRQQSVVVEHLARCPAGNNITLGHHTDPVGDRRSEPEVVCREDDTDTLVVNLLDTVCDQLRAVGVEPCQRFVKDDHARFEREDTGETDESLLPAAQ